LEIPLHNLFDISILNCLWAVVAGKRFELGDSKLIKIFELQHASFRALDMSGGLINQMPFLRFIAPEKSGYNTLMATVDINYGFLRVQ
jgi:methyl farnesoate epoxidase / farnesoate epoxidase